jgi:hypothetical protein
MRPQRWPSASVSFERAEIVQRRAMGGAYHKAQRGEQVRVLRRPIP